MAEMTFPSGNISEIAESLDDAPKDIRKVYHDYITERGLTRTILDSNRTGLIRKQEVLPYFPKGRMILQYMEWGLLIPYYDIDRTPTDYFGIRILTEEKRATFTSKSRKFVVPSGVPRLYFPLTNPDITNGVRCVITESAFKAMAASLCGYYAIGLNGCWGFSNKKKGLLPDFDAVPWDLFTDVVYVPDSDWETNEKVASAITVLADRMMSEYKIDLGHIPLRDDETEKQGLDDYLAANGLQATKDLLGSEPIKIELSGYMAAMHQLNEEVCYVRNNNMFVNVDDNYTMSLDHLKTQYAPLTYEDAQGKTKPAVRGWINWQGRNEVKQVVNAPGSETYIEELDAINLWRPSDVIPNDGDVQLHLKFMATAIPNEKERKWVQQWIGHLVQHQGIKMATSLVLYSSTQGTGKTMLGSMIRSILGQRNGAEITQEIFKNQFNGSYANKQVVIINETATGRDAVAFMEKLKTFVTEEVVVVREMRTNPYEINNLCHVILTTNNIDALKIEPSDRRFAIFELNSQFRESAEAEEWGIECWQWHRDTYNIGALLNYYQNIDLTGFEPANPAPMTATKKEMEMASRDDVEILCASFYDDKTTALEELNLRPDLRYIDAQLLIDALHIDEAHARSYSTRIGRVMKKYGFKKVQARTKNGTRRAFDLETGSPLDSQRFNHDCISPRGKKYDG